MNASSMPKVSVLVPSFNHAQFVEQAVRSVWAQTFQDIELVVVDDGSSDGSAAILHELRSRSSIPMTVEVQENRGVTATLNRALSLARGDLVSFLASDDYYDRRFIERNLEEAGRQPGPVALHCDAWLVDEHGTVGPRVYSESALPPAQGRCFEAFATSTARVVAGTIVLPRALLEELGGYDPTLKSEDFDLYLRLSRRVPFVFIDEPLYYAREVRGSLGRKPWVWAHGTVAALGKHRDFLGPRFDEILLKRQIRLSHVCFVHGGFVHGARWAGRAMKTASAEGSRLRTGTRLLKGMLSGTIQHLARRLVPARPRRFVSRGLKRMVSKPDGQRG